MIHSKNILSSHLSNVATGLARLRGINDTAALSDGGFRLQFDEWDWEIGVGVYGLYRHAAATKDDSLIAALADWYDWQISRGLPARQVNSTAPMLALACLVDHLDRPDWEELVKDWADWLCNGLTKTEDGGFQHVTKERQNEGELWDDTLFMTCLFLAKAGVRFDRQDWVDEAVFQFLLHARYLSDPKTGLWYHGWTFRGRHNFAEAFWARGNSWATIAIPELLDIVPELGGSERRFLKAILRSQVTAMAKLQCKSGFFRTLLDDPTAQIESSATAGIAYGVSRAIELGLLDESYREMSNDAFEAVLGCIDDSGIVTHCSDGTPMGHTLQFYKDIPDIPAPYGQALTMLMLVDALERASD
ncbi:beta-galactosidase BglB [Flavimaricola marinus]|uniref:Unsaturated rhamnogalacturonyl hydrolase YesR n=1 Tax=Flavimaricola marinus TaxID=1819565 RepID=A0A238LC22_9RHOB|nr:glycoside hydrolase family 88 protein [Flavimaricola marinus]SMY07267.1 Unsaturated rhamnogalacturonyl hydrolase YesR [Flavimaricola marinus]